MPLVLYMRLLCQAQADVETIRKVQRPQQDHAHPRHQPLRRLRRSLSLACRSRLSGVYALKTRCVEQHDLTPCHLNQPCTPQRLQHLGLQAVEGLSFGEDRRMIPVPRGSPVLYIFSEAKSPEDRSWSFV